MIIGAIAGVLCYLALGIKAKMNWDDSLDVIAVHLIGGVVGTLLLGFFADGSIYGAPDDEAGFFYGGGTELFLEQLLGAVFVGLFSFVVTFAIAKAIETTMGLRLSEDDELVGLDQTQHAESAYQA